MHIMHVTDTLDIGGKERILVDIANHSVQRGLKVSVCVTRTGTALAEELLADITLVVLERQSKFDLLGFQRFLTFVHEGQPDIFHIHNRSSFSLLAFLKNIGLITAPLLLHDHRGGIEIDQSIPAWFHLWGRRFVDHYVGVYDKLGSWSRRAGVLPQKISVIENAIETRRFCGNDILNLITEFQIPQADQLVGVVVGRISYQKGVDVLLHAASDSIINQKACLVWIGPISEPDYYQDCLELRDRLGLQEKVFFVGGHTEIPLLLRSADFAVLPSRSESGPLSLIEYMASGLPFVATRVGSLGKRVSELGVPGIVPPEDIDSLSRAISDLLSMSNRERIQRGQAGRELVFSYFDSKHVMERWYHLYEELIKENKV